MQGCAGSLAVLDTRPEKKETGEGGREELWYVQPADRWLQALPMGNGFLVAMVFGGTASERIAVSESTAWSGKPEPSEVNPEARAHLPEIRQMFFEGKYQKANNLSRKYLLAHPLNLGTNLPLPKLRLDFDGVGEASTHRRSLNLDRAVAKTKFRSGDQIFRRTVFAPHADGVLVVLLACSRPQDLRIHFSESKLPCFVSIADDRTLILRGRAVETKHSDGQSGVSFEIHVRASLKDGQLNTDRDALLIKNAKSVTLKVAIETTFGDADATVLSKKHLDAADKRSFSGDIPHQYLVELIAKAADDNLLKYCAAGVAGAEQNFFAIDGNTAGSAALAEMLLQSQGPEIALLPARPSAWPEGEVLGLCARGGYVVDVAWRDGALLAAKSRAKVAGQVKLRYRDGARSLPLLQGQVISARTNDCFSTRSER